MGDVGIELYAWLRSVVGVVIGAGLAVAASPEELRVGGGSLAVAPKSGNRLSVDRIDQPAESSLVGLVTEVPFRQSKGAEYGVVVATVQKKLLQRTVCNVDPPVSSGPRSAAFSPGHDLSQSFNQWDRELSD